MRYVVVYWSDMDHENPSRVLGPFDTSEAARTDASNRTGEGDSYALVLPLTEEEEAA